MKDPGIVLDEPRSASVAQGKNLLYLFACLSKEYTHKIRFMITYESKVKGPLIEQ